MALNYEFLATIRGFHVSSQVWQPEQDETLVCSHEADNPFDLFSVKATNRHGALSGHLPRKISRPTKYLLDRGASVTATLTDVKYRRSPLFHGGLEIPCKVNVEMRSTVLVSKLIGCYREMVARLYAEPQQPVIVGSYLEKEPMQPFVQPTHQRPSVNKGTKAKASKNNHLKSGPGIRLYMLPGPSVVGASSGVSKTPRKKISKVIEINSDSE